MSVRNVFGSLAGDELSRLLYQACPDAVIVIDDTGTILFANPAVETLFGYTPEDVVGEHLAMLQPESLRDAHRRGLARYMATGEPKLDWRATQTFGLHKDGHEFPVEIAFTGLAARRFGGFIRDVSKRVEAERALEASDARYRDLLDHAADVVYQHDMAGTFVYLNDAGLRTFGYTAEEAVTLNISDIVDSDHLGAAVKNILAQLDAGVQVAPYELLTRTKSGQRIWFEVSVRVATDDQGGLIGYRGIARNVDERKRAEEALKATEERYRELMDNANDIIYTHDLQGLFTYVNAAGALTVTRTRKCSPSTFARS